MQLSLSDLNLVYACTRHKTLMIDVQAREISERDLEAGLRLAHPEVWYNGIFSYFLMFSSASYTKKITVWLFRLSSLLNLRSGWQKKWANQRRNIDCPWLQRERWRKSRAWWSLVLKLFLQIQRMERCSTFSMLGFSVRDSSFTILLYDCWFPICKFGAARKDFWQNELICTMLCCLLSVWKWR